ncbi:hypothetical protein [Coraliomargarita parva]|uniref:hypothetical protein n=1 Tax=Coraliomargarita parva TaxID=3014050 RepID=UPI0022B5BC7B|nr:hypothetical protein [Coraliomargarita parva]
MPERYAWISGWGIRAADFESAVMSLRPDAHHLVLEPTQWAVDDLLAFRPDHIVGYSLGSLLLLHAIDRLPDTADIVCLAPILGFCRECGLGGTTPQASLGALQRKLLQSPHKALKLFYRLSGLDEKPQDSLPYRYADLSWGLQALNRLRAAPEATQRVFAIIGEQDPLLRSQTLEEYFDHTFTVSTGHAYPSLIAAYLNDSPVFTA